MKIRTIALRNIFRNRKRSILSMSAIAVAAMTITVMFSMFEGMRNDLRLNLQTYHTGQIRIRNSEYDRFEQLNPLHLGVEKSAELTEKLSAAPGIKYVSPRILFPGSIFMDDERHSFSGLGVDFSLEKDFMNIDDILISGRLPEKGMNEAVAGYRLAEALEFDAGDSITILTTTRTRGTNAFTVKITGLLAFPVDLMNNKTLMIPLDRARHFLWMGDTVTEILLKLDRGVSDDTGLAAAQLILESSGIGSSTEARKWIDIGTTYSMFEYMKSVYFFIAVFFFIIGSTVIVNTTMMTVFERIREIGTLGAMGMEDRKLVSLFFLEAFYLGIAGSLLGVIIGAAIVIPLSYFGIDYGEAMEGIDMGISAIIYPRLSIRTTVFVFFYSLAIASLTSLIPSRRAANIQPVEALRSV